MAAQLLCVGFSARAAASSARRAGFQPLAADHFADRDLAASQVRRIARYPADLLQAVADLPAVPLVYGGALENYPEIVERLQKERIVWGNDAATLRRVRDPFQLAAVLQAVGQPLPPLTTCPDQLPRDGSWLSKNGRGSGGGHVRGWYGQSGPGQPCGYFQQRQEGIPCSAVFVGAAGQAQLLGTTRQLIGLPGADTDSFHYAGSIGPLPLPDATLAAWQRIGDALAQEFHLVGLFGVDAILQGPTLWPLEVNPRYTASVEVLERARGWLAMSLHVEACQHARLPAAAPHSSTLPRSCGKAILYARRNVALGGRFEELVAQWNQAADWPTLTDIPPPGSVIGARRPICSIHAKGVDLETVADQLRALAAELEANLYHERG